MSKNDITGDRLVSKKPSKEYDDGYDRIFKVNKKDTLEDSVRLLEEYLDKCKEQSTKCLDRCREYSDKRKEGNK